MLFYIRDTSALTNFYRGLRAFCTVLLFFAAMESSAVAEGPRAFLFYNGDAESLIQLADNYMMGLYPGVKRVGYDQSASQTADFLQVQYIMPYPTPTVMYGAVPANVFKGRVKVRVHKPYTLVDGQPVVSGARAERAALAKAFEEIAIELSDAEGRGNAILEKSFPDDYTYYSLSNKKTNDPRFHPETGEVVPPGSYFFYRTDAELTLVAANVFICIDETKDVRDTIAEAVLAGFVPGQSVETKVEVFPYAGLSPSDKGLVPASERLPAKIVFSGAAPGKPATFVLTSPVPGELRGAGLSGKTVVVPVDSSGQAIAFYHYLSSGALLDKPLEATVQVSCDGQTKKATIHVGLGLSFERLKTVLGQTYENNLYAFSLTVKSRFHPDLNLAAYLFNADQAKIWGDSYIGFKLYTEWVNRPDDAPHDDYYLGTANIVAGEDKMNFLKANQKPWYTPAEAKFIYPAVVMNSAGKHAYRLNGRGAVLGPDGVFAGYLDEAMDRSDTLLILSKDDSESWYQSLACSLNATTEEQYLMLEAVKLIPVYGAIADKAATVSGFICGVMEGDCEKSLMDLASWVGAQYLDNLMEPATFNKLTKKQQDAVLAAKGLTTGGTDNYKRKQDANVLRESKE